MPALSARPLQHSDPRKSRQQVPAEAPLPDVPRHKAPGHTQPLRKAPNRHIKRLRVGYLLPLGSPLNGMTCTVSGAVMPLPHSSSLNKKFSQDDLLQYAKKALTLKQPSRSVLASIGSRLLRDCTGDHFVLACC